MKAKFFTVFCLIITMFAIISCSAGKEEGSISITLPSKEALAREGISTNDDADCCTIFITGDYTAKKRVAFIEGESATVNFDSIPEGAKVRVACTFNDPAENNQAYGYIGVSDEITIVANEALDASVAMSAIQFSNSLDVYNGYYAAKVFYGEEWESCLSLPSSCSYKFTFVNEFNEEDYPTRTYQTSSALVNLSEDEGDDFACNYNVTVQIFCNGTKILQLFKSAVH
ncbi:MAG: hypothetical protein J6X11_00730 [Treponema sp.]|nr:hypothetical protein [Treponema sp.]